MHMIKVKLNNTFNMAGCVGTSVTGLAAWNIEKCQGKR